jgi:hypothetical protein
MSERGLTNRWGPWQRLIDSIAPYYGARLFAVRDRGRGELCDLEEGQLEAIAAQECTVRARWARESAR